MSFDPPCDDFVAWKGAFVEILSFDPGDYLGEGTRASLETGQVWTYDGELVGRLAGQAFAAEHRDVLARMWAATLDERAESARVEAEADEAEWRRDTMEGR